jgi:hypothetical protein
MVENEGRMGEKWNMKKIRVCKCEGGSLLGDLDKQQRIKLKYARIWKDTTWECGMNSSGSRWSLVIRRSGHGNETSDVTQGKKFLE